MACRWRARAGPRAGRRPAISGSIGLGGGLGLWLTQHAGGVEVAAVALGVLCLVCILPVLTLQEPVHSHRAPRLADTLKKSAARSVESRLLPPGDFGAGAGAAADGDRRRRQSVRRHRGGLEDRRRYRRPGHRRSVGRGVRGRRVAAGFHRGPLRPQAGLYPLRRQHGALHRRHGDTAGDCCFTL